MVVVGAELVDERPKVILPPELAREIELGSGEVDVGRNQINTRLRPDDRSVWVSFLVSEGIVDRDPLVGWIHAGRDGEAALRIHVDHEHAVALPLQRYPEIERGRRLADAALLIGENGHERGVPQDGHRAAGLQERHQRILRDAVFPTDPRSFELPALQVAEDGLGVDPEPVGHLLGG